MKSQLGVLFTCYNETEAITFALDQFSIHYPDSKIYLVTESSDLSLKYNDPKIKIVYDEDTMGFYYQDGADKLPHNFTLPENQEKIQTAVRAFLQRLCDAIEFCDSEYMLLMDPDTLVRGKLNIPDGSKLLGSLLNHGTPKAFKNVLSSVGANPINSWGATPGILHVATFIEAIEKFKSIPNLLERLTQSWYAMYAHDIIVPTIFSLIGVPETKNSDLTECNTDPSWETSGAPLVHHFKKYYPNCKEKFPWFQSKSH